MWASSLCTIKKKFADLIIFVLGFLKFVEDQQNLENLTLLDYNGQTNGQTNRQTSQIYIYGCVVRICEQNEGRRAVKISEISWNNSVIFRTKCSNFEIAAGSLILQIKV